MASKKVRDGLSTQPSAEPYATSDPEAVAEVRRKRRKREANVYDAVAGRVTSTLPLDDIDDEDDESGNDLSDSDATATRQRRRRQPAHMDRRRDPILAPEEVLFRRIGAPVRFAEKDIYHAHEALPNEGRDVLPDSDMVKAVHSYASHYYAALAAATTTTTQTTTGEREDGGASTPRGGKGGVRGKGRARKVEGSVDEQSMDETALLAFGILLEEAGREILGKRGDLVFTEGVEVSDDEVGKSVDGDFGPVGFLDARRWKQRHQSRGTTRKSKKRDEVYPDEVKY
ncbi:hypothetical protein SLS62_003170 [Diatrype stigma]|uniref:Uncharacterized protein n=1 Tax=Diatrype stigma TaxID=117547 RepID=A0AAN9UVR8_9PEZI